MNPQSGFFWFPTTPADVVFKGDSSEEGTEEEEGEGTPRADVPTKKRCWVLIHVIRLGGIWSYVLRIG